MLFVFLVQIPVCPELISHLVKIAHWNRRECNNIMEQDSTPEQTLWGAAGYAEISRTIAAMLAPFLTSEMANTVASC